MANVLVEKDSLEDIADAIRAKNGTQSTYKPREMAQAISEIGGGITPTGTKQISQNGTHDVTDYASAQVNVPNSYSASDEGKVVEGGSLVNQSSASYNANGTYDTTLINEAIVNIPMAVDLIDTYETNLEDYTDTSTSQTITTTIDVKASPYALVLIEITCDSAITTSTEWGMTFALAGKYTSNGQLYLSAGLVGQFKGASSFSQAGVVSNASLGLSYGVTLSNNVRYVTFSRKAHATGMPKVRGGKYTVKAYGLTGQ